MVALFHLVSRKSRKWILVGIQGPSENEDRNTSFTLSEKYILDNSGLFDQLDANLIYGRPRSSLYVSQIVLTPSAWNIVSNIDSSLEKWEAPTMNKSLQWLNLHHAGGRHGFNIVIRDFVDTEFTRTGFVLAFLVELDTFWTLFDAKNPCVKVIAKNLYPENDVVSRVWSLPK